MISFFWELLNHAVVGIACLLAFPLAFFIVISVIVILLKIVEGLEE